MKIRIGNDIRLRVNVNLRSSNNIAELTSLLYTSSFDLKESSAQGDLIQDKNGAYIRRAVLNCVKTSGKIELKYTGTSTQFHYKVSGYTIDDLSGVKDYSDLTESAIGTLEDVKVALCAEYQHGMYHAVVVWSDNNEVGNTISVYETTDVYATEAPLNIQSIKAYLINTTVAENHLKDLKNKTRFLGRFPIEPFLDEYTPTQYNINCSGHPKYHTLVANRYGGFGIYPKWKDIIPHKERNDYKFLAPVYRTKNSNEIDVMFPATMLLHPGKYSLLLIVKLYEYGYSNTNTRTITTDYPNAVELVSTSAEADFDGSTDIDLRMIDSSAVTKIDQDTDIYTYKGVYEDGNITLGLTNGRSVDIDVTDINGWYEEG